MKKAPYPRTDGKDLPYDEYFEQLVHSWRGIVAQKNDDYFLLCVGTRGTGKSDLSLHAYTIYEENPTVDRVALNRHDFARALNYATKDKNNRYVNYDEANVSKREAMSSWNREVIDLYFAIRGLGLVHWWNNPSAEMIDKVFIQEVVKALIFIDDKSKHRPRKYYFIPKNALMEMYERNGSLRPAILKKYAKTFAYYEGWFRAYKGPLRAEYDARKDERMQSKVEEFFDKHARGPTWTLSEAAERAGVHRETYRRWLKEIGEYQATITASGKHAVTPDVHNRVVAAMLAEGVR